MPETVIGKLNRLAQEAQKRVDDCEKKDPEDMAGVIGFPRHRKDPCEELKKELADLNDQLNRALANADGIKSDPLGNAIAGGLAAGLAGGVADLASLASDGIESLVGDEAGGGIAEGAPGEGGTEQPPSTGGEKEPPPPDSSDVEADDRQQRPRGEPEDLHPDEGGTNPDAKPTWER